MKAFNDVKNNKILQFSVAKDIKCELWSKKSNLIWLFKYKP